MLIIKMNNSAETRQNKPERGHKKGWRSFNDILDNAANEPRYTGKRISYRDLGEGRDEAARATLGVHEIKILNDKRALLSYDDKKYNRHKVYQKLATVNENNAPSLFNPNNEKTEITI